jgi:hypothetical protein
MIPEQLAEEISKRRLWRDFDDIITRLLEEYLERLEREEK